LPHKIQTIKIHDARLLPDAVRSMLRENVLPHSSHELTVRSISAAAPNQSMTNEKKTLYRSSKI